ncbi:hypothetical protein N7522_002714 [Penicillium canescens]|nr:hypothetical protein N7522_002714 [Penicillium canescens]
MDMFFSTCSQHSVASGSSLIDSSIADNSGTPNAQLLETAVMCLDLGVSHAPSADEGSWGVIRNVRAAERGSQYIVSTVDFPTRREYDHLSKGIAPGGLVDLWTTVAVVTMNVTNSGHRAGFAVPQLYVSLPQATTPAGTSAKVLRGFEKVFLEVNEVREVRFELRRRDLSY